MPNQPTRKSQIIRAMTEVFRESGYDGTTLSKLMVGTGLERASLYHYFPGGKTAMAAAVLQDVLGQLREDVLSALSADAPPKERIANMLDATDAFYNGGNDLCFISIFAVGVNDEGLSAALQSAVAGWLEALEATLSDAGVLGAEELAHAALSCVQGGLVLAASQNDPRPFQHALKHLRASLVPAG